MFISNLPLTARIALRVANEAMTMYKQACVTQPEILFENLKRTSRIGPLEGNFFEARYRPFGPQLDRRNDYVVRIVLKRNWAKMGKSNWFEADGFALVSRKGEVTESYPFKTTWSGINDGLSVIFKREGGGFYPIF